MQYIQFNPAFNESHLIYFYYFRTLTSYMMWQVSRSLSTYLSKSFRDATKILRKALFGSEGTEESWRYCVTDTNNAVGKSMVLRNSKVQGFVFTFWDEFPEVQNKDTKIIFSVINIIEMSSIHSLTYPSTFRICSRRHVRPRSLPRRSEDSRRDYDQQYQECFQEKPEESGLDGRRNPEGC